MIAILRNGPLAGREIELSIDDRFYSERIAGNRVVYQQTTEYHPESMKMYYDYREPVPEKTQESTDETPDEQEDDSD